MRVWEASVLLFLFNEHVGEVLKKIFKHFTLSFAMLLAELGDLLLNFLIYVQEFTVKLLLVRSVVLEEADEVR